MIYFSVFLQEWSTSSDIPKIIISAVAFVSQGIKQPCKTKALAEIIIFGKPADERIASTAPLYVQKIVTFLVKTGTGCLADTRDLKTDKRMDKSKTKSFYFKMNDENLGTAREDNYDYKVTRFVYIRKVNKDFHKVIILVKHREEGNVPLVYIKFYFDGKEHNLEPVPCHGNNLKKR